MADRDPWSSVARPYCVLAPMEGVTDAPMRAYLTSRGGYSFCVSEFLRISHQCLPDWVIERHVPESRHGWRTAAGTPVALQLLGGSPELLAETAAQGVRLGAPAIDLNFGCPAPTVNRSDGGATLLRYPERIGAIVRAVRSAVPAHIPVSAKLRLGWEDPTDIDRNADRAAEAGASWLTIHGRTRAQGYRPPALWEPIARVRRRLAPQIPVIANGDLWTAEEVRRCQEVLGEGDVNGLAIDVMLGRGALADPFLARRIRGDRLVTWDGALERWRPELLSFAQEAYRFVPTGGYVPKRIKQWVKLAATRYPIDWFEQLKPLNNVSQVAPFLNVSSLAVDTLGDEV